MLRCSLAWRSILKEKDTSRPLSCHCRWTVWMNLFRVCVPPGSALSKFVCVCNLFHADDVDLNPPMSNTRDSEYTPLASVSKNCAGLVHIWRLVLIRRCRDCGGPYTPRIYVWKCWGCCRLMWTQGAGFMSLLGKDCTRWSKDAQLWIKSSDHIRCRSRC